MSLFDRLKKTPKQSTRELINVKSIEQNSIKTCDDRHILYFLVKPVNLAVLSRSSIEVKINALMNVIKGIDSVEFVAMNSREDFESNKQMLRKRFGEESNEAVRTLLAKDLQFLDRVQVQTASAREFLICLRFKHEDDILPNVSRVEKLLGEQGFNARLALQDDIKRLFAVYFAQNVTQLVMDDYDGERWAK